MRSDGGCIVVIVLFVLILVTCETRDDVENMEQKIEKIEQKIENNTQQLENQKHEIRENKNANR